jgi:hypothetical protein
MIKKIILILLLSINTSLVSASLNATFAENKLQYGEPVMLETLPSSHGFTGFATYWLDLDWKLIAFFKNDKVRLEHLLPRETRSPKLTRDEVRTRAFKMFLQAHRGVYHKELKFPRAEGHFFDKGLIAYEYKMSGNKVLGYQGIKVLFYEDNQSFIKINPKAYL